MYAEVIRGTKYPPWQRDVLPHVLRVRVSLADAVDGATGTVTPPTDVCVPCNPGQFTNTTGATACTPCPANTTANYGRTYCEPCPRGERGAAYLTRPSTRLYRWGALFALRRICSAALGLEKGCWLRLLVFALHASPKTSLPKASTTTHPKYFFLCHLLPLHTHSLTHTVMSPA